MICHLNNMNKDNYKPIIAITMGDPAGIGPEIILKSLKNSNIHKISVPVVIGSSDILQECTKQLNIDIKIKPIDSIEQAKSEINCIDLINVGNYLFSDIGVGKVGETAGKAAIDFIEESARLALSKKIDGIATAPINKESINKSGLMLLGHTEMLSYFTQSNEVITIFLMDNVKIFFVTRHLSLRDAVNAINIDSILKTILTADSVMYRLGYDKYRMAVSALNPHAGENGLFGDDEIRYIIPAIREAQSKGINVNGPIGADSVFHQALEGKYDCVISLYHDQGHIAAKTYDFYGTITATIGLPVIRTSPDHGTGLDIAWKGIANHKSMEKAIIASIEIAKKTLE